MSDTIAESDKASEQTHIGDNPFVTRKSAKSRKSGAGIGHNSGTGSEDGRKNVSLETISQHVLIAQEKVAEYGGMLTSNAAEIETKGIETLSAIYVVSYGIKEAGAYDQFLTK